jgi:hypothetical protein
MKLLLCLECSDVQALTYKERTCHCGKSTGYYLEDGVRVMVSGPCRVLGIANDSLAQAVAAPDRTDGMGQEFLAFVIPRVCEKVKRLNLPTEGEA